MNGASRPRRLRPRPGLTLVEMMIVVVLLSVVGGTVMSVLAKQQAFYRSTSDVMDLRSQLRQASAVLASDLRGIASSAVAGDIVSMSESSIDFYYNIGNSVVCDVNMGSGTVTLPPRSLSRGNMLTQWTSRPARNDSIHIYSDPDTTSATDDAWQSFAVDTLITNTGLCLNTSGLTVPGDNGTPSYEVRVSSSGPSMVTGIRRGSTVRFMRRAYYQIYLATDGRSYLGFCSPTCTTSNPLQPIAGPFNNFAAGSATSGLAFTYYDVNGNVTADRTQVARISFVLRGQSRAQINIPGMGKGFYTDSLRTDVAIRNRT